MKKFWKKVYQKTAVFMTAALMINTVAVVPGFAKEVYSFEDGIVTNSDIVTDDYWASASITIEKEGDEGFEVKVGQQEVVTWSLAKKVTIASASVATDSGWESMEESEVSVEELAAYMASYVTLSTDYEAADEQSEALEPYFQVGKTNIEDDQEIAIGVDLTGTVVDLEPGTYTMNVIISADFDDTQFDPGQYSIQVEEEKVFPITVVVKEKLPTVTAEWLDGAVFNYTSSRPEPVWSLSEFLEPGETIEAFGIEYVDDDFGTYFEVGVDTEDQTLWVKSVNPDPNEDVPVSKKMKLELVTDKCIYTGTITIAKLLQQSWDKLPTGQQNLVVGRTYKYALKDMPENYNPEKHEIKHSDNVEISMSDDHSVLYVTALAEGYGYVDLVYWNYSAGYYYYQHMLVKITKAGSSSGGGSGSGSGGGSGSSSSAVSAGSTSSDPVKGMVSSTLGIVTGSGNGYSSWAEEKKADGSTSWKLQYANGTTVAGTVVTKEDGTTYEQPAWEKVNGSWYAFGADGFAKNGFVTDPALGGTFYVDIMKGMATGWQQIDGIWRYFNSNSDGKLGIMAVSTTIDGYRIDEKGVRVE